jgi:dipeptidyl aminopeptidase/acylaminoacyl peptidase
MGRSPAKNMPYSINARFLVDLCFSILLVCGLSSAHDNPKALPIEEVLRLRDFVDWSPPAISPDGKWLAYAVRETSTGSAPGRTNTLVAPPVRASGTDIYVGDIEGGETRSLTHHDGNNWLPVWSPDGRYLAFLSDRTNNEPRLWIWDSIRQEFKLASDLEAQTEQIEWMPDSHNLLITVASKEPRARNTLRVSSPLEEVEKGAEPGEKNASVLVYSSSALASTSPKLARDGPWNLDEKKRDLALIDFTRGTAKVLVHAKRIAAYLLSPDGTAVAYTSPLRFESQGSQQILFSLAIIQISTGEERHIDTQLRLDYDGAEFSWSPDGGLLAVQTGGMDETHSDCFVVVTRDSSVRNVTTFAKEARSHSKASTPLWDEKGNIYLIHDGQLWRTSAEEGRAIEVGRVPDREIVRLIPGTGSLLWIPRGKFAVLVTHNAISKQDGFFSMDLDDGESRKLLERGECYTCANVAESFTVTTRSAELVYFAEDAAHHADLWITQPDFAQSRRLTYLNPGLDEYQLATPRLI